MAIPLVGVAALIQDPLGMKISQDSSDTSQINETKCKSAITSERLAQIKKLVEDAIREHRIFTIKGGWQTLRRAFLQRNWIEKFDSTKLPKAPNSTGSTDELCSNLPSRQSWETPSAHIVKCERTIMSRLLQMHDVDFYWNTRKDQHDVHLRMNCHKLINRFSRSLFTSKEGLCLLLQQMYWHNEQGVAAVNFPRCYVLGFPDHYSNFIEDFRLTACMSMLKYVIHKFEKEDQYAVQSPEGLVPYSAFTFAMDRLNEFLCFRKHLDIDMEIPAIETINWDQFLQHFRNIVHEHMHFLESKEYSLPCLCTSAKTILKKVTGYWPQFDLDGMKNIWIMKPGNKCRGRGIQLLKDYKDVAKIMELKLKYVVQKYIEKPLILYNTKFDIRQWFMITSVQPLAIWMYRESYLRFSSQNFSLDNFHESLHLTNHAVQCKYKNATTRDKALPDENMWDCHMFKDYLKSIGQENKWDSVIYPGMKECIIGSMLACQDTMDRRPNTFELYGADFILAEDYQPWLLEINSCPDLSSSTSVTARMCQQCLQDLVKVVIDKRKDINCETGLFDSVYKQNLPRTPAYLGMTLSVRGRRVFKRHKTKRDKENDSIKKVNSSRTKLSPPEIEPGGSAPPAILKKYSGPVIADLMEEIQKRLHNDSDCEAGYEMASPCIKTPKKKVSKSENRVSKVAKYICNSNTNKSTSPSLKPRGSVASKIQLTAEIKQQSKISSLEKRSRVSFGSIKEWTNNLEIKEKELPSAWAKHSSISILRGKSTADKLYFNKLHNHKYESHSALVQNTYSKLGFGSSRERKTLLTIGYGLGIRHINRPNT